MPWPKWRIVQSSPKIPKRKTTSTQLKVRLMAATPSCGAVDFISIAISTFSERPPSDQLLDERFSCKYLFISHIHDGESIQNVSEQFFGRAGLACVSVYNRGDREYQQRCLSVTIL